MKVTCENCNSPYEMPSGLEGKVACPMCKHLSIPRAVNLEETRPQIDLEAEYHNPPVRTMVFYPDAAQKDDPVTAIERAVRGKELCRPQGHEVSVQILQGDQAASPVPLSKGRNVLGRSAQSDIMLRDPEVSSRHCAIELYETVAVLKDLGSTNGTILNGYLVKEDFLKDGDKIQLGSTTLQFCMKPK